MDKPKLLLLVTLAERGGAQSYVRDLLPGLVQRFDVTVAAYGPGPLRDAVRAAGADFVALRHVRRAISARDALGLIELLRLCRRLRPDVLHANSSKAGVLGRLAGALARVPVRVFTVHGWAFKATSGIAAQLYLWCDRAMRPLTTAIVCVSETELRAGLAARTCTAEQTVVIRNGVEVERAGVRRHEAVSPVEVVSVGRLAEPKDFATLVEACGLLSGASFRLSILGDGPERPAIEAAVRTAGLESVVALRGEVADVPQRLAEADIFVLSSTSEGLPISVLEAMAAGLPIVASDVGGLRELVVEDVNGYLVPDSEPAELAAALRRLIGDVELRRRLGDASRRRALEHFALQDWRAAHVALFERLIAARSSSGRSG